MFATFVVFTARPMYSSCCNEMVHASVYVRNEISSRCWEAEFGAKVTLAASISKYIRALIRNTCILSLQNIPSGLEQLGGDGSRYTDHRRVIGSTGSHVYDSD